MIPCAGRETVRHNFDRSVSSIEGVRRQDYMEALRVRRERLPHQVARIHKVENRSKLHFNIARMQRLACKDCSTESYPRPLACLDPPQKKWARSVR